MTDTTEKAVHVELQKARDTWYDLPKWVYTDEYEKALTEWIEKHVANGRTDIDTLVLYTLHHETGDKMPYFPFDRKVKRKRARTN